MGKALLYLCGTALCCWAVMITFKILKFLCRRIKNYTFNKWVSPIIAGLLGACVTASIVLIAWWLYSSFEPLHVFIDRIINL